MVTKSLLAITIVLAISVAPGMSLKASADVGGSITNGDPIAPVINDMKSAIKDIIQQIESSVGISQFRIRQSLEILLGDLQYKLLELEGKTFRDVQTTQHQFFLNAETTIQEARKALTEPLNQIDGIATRVENSVARIPGADKSSRIHRVSPIYILQNQKSQQQTIIVTGSELNHGKVSLNFSDHQCTKGNHIDSQITFLCDLSHLQDSNLVSPAVGQLEVEQYRSMWQEFIDLFKRKNLKAKQYSLMIQVVPNSLGTYDISARKPVVTVSAPATRSQFIEAANGHCEKDHRHGPYPINRQGTPGSPLQQWEIIPESIRLGNEEHGNQGRSVEGPTDLTKTSFNMWIRLSNGGKCVFGDGDTRATLKVPVIWQEVRTTNDTKDYSPDKNHGELLWGTDVPIELQPDSTFTLTIHQINKENPVAIAPRNDLKWVRIDVSPDNTQILIRPRPVAEALQ